MITARIISGWSEHGIGRVPSIFLDHRPVELLVVDETETEVTTECLFSQDVYESVLNDPDYVGRVTEI